MHVLKFLKILNMQQKHDLEMFLKNKPKKLVSCSMQLYKSIATFSFVYKTPIMCKDNMQRKKKRIYKYI